jgi:hypothetical protein
MWTQPGSLFLRISFGSCKRYVSFYIFANGKIYTELVTNAAFSMPLPIAFGEDAAVISEQLQGSSISHL